MPIELPQYDPKDVQPRWIEFWQKQHLFRRQSQSGEEAPHDHDPAPQRHGALHWACPERDAAGSDHALAADAGLRKALWMPGTTIAGIATQAVVERRMLEEEGKTRHDIGREALVQRIWKWKTNTSPHSNQLKQLGSSCDWRRTRFTLDDVCSGRCAQTFFKMFKDGFIFRGKRLSTGMLTCKPPC